METRLSSIGFLNCVETIRTVLSANLLNRHFDPTKLVLLLTDASHHHGLGFALCQKTSEGHLYNVICASKSFIDTHRCYSTIELEFLAIKWFIPKCLFYLLGLPKFNVVTDHRQLYLGLPKFRIFRTSELKFLSEVLDKGSWIDFLTFYTKIVSLFTTNKFPKGFVLPILSNGRFWLDSSRIFIIYHKP